MKNRIISVLTVLSVILYMILPVFAESDVININSKRDFSKFAEKCTLDTWSQGKVVNLNSDLDFSGGEFVSAATFGGTFNGNGHKLSGICDSGKGSYRGVFRYVQNGGKVSDLTVNAEFVPNGSKSFIGGIVGENSGIIENCMFFGNVTGENVIGGIAGNNRGTINACSVGGIISGENSTGGIAGKNSGFIRGCVNNASVNTFYEEKKTDITDIDADSGAIIENYKNFESETEEESVLGNSDTGGIAGYSDGVVGSCKNYGSIGYKHVGYNIGGIVGRQCGYMSGCENYGEVKGRKDVGGITGQAEPYILLNVTEGGLESLRGELDALDSAVNAVIADAESFGSGTDLHLRQISEYTDSARKNTEAMLDAGTDFADDNIGEINVQAAIISNTLDKLGTVFDKLESGCTNLNAALKDINNALDEISVEAPDLKSDIDGIKSALNTISKSVKKLKKAFLRLKSAKNDLNSAITLGDSEEARKALADLSEAVDNIAAENGKIAEEIGRISDIVTGSESKFEGAGTDTETILQSLGAIRESVEKIMSYSVQIKENLVIILPNTEIDFAVFGSAASNINTAVDYIIDAMTYLSLGLENLGSALSDLDDSVSDYTEKAGNDLENAKSNLKDGTESLAYAVDDIKYALSDLDDIIGGLADEKTPEFVKLGDDFRKASSGLFGALSGISDGLGELRGTVTGETDKIRGGLTSVTNRFKRITDLLVTEFESINNSSLLSDIFVDVSDEDIENTVQGKIEDCVNYGTLSADRNVGGICGVAAAEYSKDPEDELKKPDSLNFTYQTRAILYKCINNGKITGKKDCVGGIAGNAEIGTLYGCENYGSVKSTGGGYVGGIAGESGATVRKCFAKSAVKGKKYVGGIVGKSAGIISSYSISDVSGEEYTGAVAGDVKNTDSLHGNYFVGNGQGAVDGISYRSKAEPISFEDLSAYSGIPNRFVSFTVTFTADGKTVKTQDIKYGMPTSEIDYPQIPEKDGCFGNWKKTKSETITGDLNINCVYEPYITVISSCEKNGKLSLALAEGEFSDKAVLHIRESSIRPPVKLSENVKVYDIELSENHEEQVKFHILNPDKKRVTAWVYNDGEWQKTKISEKGKYVVLRSEGTNASICIKYDDRKYIVTIMMILSGAGFFAAILIRKKIHHVK